MADVEEMSVAATTRATTNPSLLMGFLRWLDRPTIGLRARSVTLRTGWLEAGPSRRDAGFNGASKGCD
jgi:hypothetical protein